MTETILKILLIVLLLALVIALFTLSGTLSGRLAGIQRSLDELSKTGRYQLAVGNSPGVFRVDTVTGRVKEEKE